MTERQKDPLSYWQSRAIKAEQDLEQMQMDRDDAAAACEQLHEDNKALAAQVERLREAADKIKHWHDTKNDGMIVSARAVMGLWSVLDETPEQSLRKVRAEAVESAERYACKHFNGSGNAELNDILEYAQQIREGKE